MPDLEGTQRHGNYSRLGGRLPRERVSAPTSPILHITLINLILAAALFIPFSLALDFGSLSRSVVVSVQELYRVIPFFRFFFPTRVAGGGLRPSFEHSPWLSAFSKCRAQRYGPGALKGRCGKGNICTDRLLRASCIS